MLQLEYGIKKTESPVPTNEKTAYLTLVLFVTKYHIVDRYPLFTQSTPFTCKNNNIIDVLNV